MTTGIASLLNQSECILEPEDENVSISYTVFMEAVQALAYASAERVILLFLAYTGCRVTELKNIYIYNLSGNTIFWACGKNQKGERKETLPDSYLEELKEYRSRYKTDDKHMFHMKGRAWRRAFNQLRPQIGGSWMERSGKTLNCSWKQAAYKVQPRALRKVFQTILFQYYYEKYGDADVALIRVSKRMRHSSKGITGEHYVESAEQIEARKWVQYFYSKKPKYESQKRLFDF